MDSSILTIDVQTKLETSDGLHNMSSPTGFIFSQLTTWSCQEPSSKNIILMVPIDQNDMTLYFHNDHCDKLLADISDFQAILSQVQVLTGENRPIFNIYVASPFRQAFIFGALTKNKAFEVDLILQEQVQSTFRIIGKLQK
jgi:hypothetical protein